MFLVIAVIPTTFLNSESSRVPFLSGDNFSDRKDKILLTLGCMDFDLALRVDEQPTPTETSEQTEVAAYELWE